MFILAPHVPSFCFIILKIKIKYKKIVFLIKKKVTDRLINIFLSFISQLNSNTAKKNKLFEENTHNCKTNNEYVCELF